jgi:Na+-driven multidrug efflux pump
LMNAASIWIGVGVNVLIAGYLGQKKQDEANETVTHGLLLAFGIGALLNLMSLLIMKPYFRAFTNNEEIYQLSIAYMSVCSFMQIPNMVHIAIQKMIQATGNMVAPMWFQIAGVVVNFVFDPILIFGIGIFPAMGIRGAAVATVAGYLLSMILAFALLLGKKQKVQVKIKDFHLKKQMIYRIFASMPCHHHKCNEQSGGFRNRKCKPDSVQLEQFVQTPQGRYKEKHLPT